MRAAKQKALDKVDERLIRIVEIQVGNLIFFLFLYNI